MTTEQQMSRIEEQINDALGDASKEILDHHDSIRVLSLARASKELAERRYLLKKMRRLV